MTQVTEDEIKINNEIYETIVEGGMEVLRNPISFRKDITPIEYLDGCIQFFSDLDSVDGYNKCANLIKMRDKLINESK